MAASSFMATSGEFSFLIETSYLGGWSIRIKQGQYDRGETHTFQTYDEAMKAVGQKQTGIEAWDSSSVEAPRRWSEMPIVIAMP